MPQNPSPTFLDAAKADAWELRSLMKQVADIKCRLLEIAETPIGRHLHAERIRAAAAELYHCIHFAQPYAGCPYCGDAPEAACRVCGGTGWTNKTMYEAAPAEMKVSRVGAGP